MKRAEPDAVVHQRGQECSICMEVFSAAGKHRVVSLRCGHVFGRSCITSWIESKSNAGCPMCKAKVRKQDLRNLYTSQVTVVDDAGKEELVQELHTTKRELNALALRYDMLLSKYEALKKTVTATTVSSNVNDVARTPGAMQMELYVELGLGGQGRVAHHSMRDASILFGHASRVGRVSLLEGANTSPTYFSVHNTSDGGAPQIVRDICSRLQDDLVLSCCGPELVVWNVHSRNVVHRTHTGTSAVAAMVWDASDAFAFHAASRNVIRTYDLRRLDHETKSITLPHPQPVHSLLCAGSQLMACSLGGVCDATHGTVLIEGAIHSFCHSDDALVCSYRASEDGVPSKHVVFGRDAQDPLRWGAREQWYAQFPNTVLSRSSLFHGLFACGDSNILALWELKNRNPTLAVRRAETRPPITDAVLCAETPSSEAPSFAAALTPSSFHLYKLRT
jgi:hypothetical protein